MGLKMKRKEAEELKKAYQKQKANKINQKQHANRPNYSSQTLIGNWCEEVRPFNFTPIRVEPISTTQFSKVSGKTRMNTARNNKEAMHGTKNLFIVGDKSVPKNCSPSSDVSRKPLSRSFCDAATMTSTFKVKQFGTKRYGW